MFEMTGRSNSAEPCTSIRPMMFERNLGWRIDHIYATPELAARCTSCEIDKSLRETPRPSDHTAVIATF